MTKLLFSIYNRVIIKIQILWCYLFAFYHKDRFMSAKYWLLPLTAKKNDQEFSSNLTDKSNLLDQEGKIDKTYRENIHFYGYESFAPEALLDKIAFFNGSPLEQTMTFNDVVYYPEHRAFYLLDGSRIKYSSYTENPTAPKIISLPEHLPKIDGSFIYGGHLNRHYGHFLTESICRLWYLGKDDTRPIIYSESPRFSIEKNYIDDLMIGLFDKKRFICFSQPVQLKEVTIPYPSFVFGKQAFSIHKLLPESIATKLLPTSFKTKDQPIYFSRRKLTKQNAFRITINEDILEEKLSAHNFLIVYSEELTLEQKILLVNQHKIITGLYASALHNIFFNITSIPHLVCITDDDWVESNFFLVDGIKSSHTHYIQGTIAQKNIDVQWLRRDRLVQPEKIISGLHKIGLI